MKINFGLLISRNWIIIVTCFSSFISQSCFSGPLGPWTGSYRTRRTRCQFDLTFFPKVSLLISQDALHHIHHDILHQFTPARLFSIFRQFFTDFDVSHEMQNQSLLRDASARSSTLSLFGSLDLSFTCATSIVLFSILIDMGKSALDGDLFLHYCLCSWLLRRSRVFSHFTWWLLNNTSTSGLRQKSRCIIRVRKIFVNVLCYCDFQFGYMISEATRLDRSFVWFFTMGSDRWKRWE